MAKLKASRQVLTDAQLLSAVVQPAAKVAGSRYEVEQAAERERQRYEGERIGWILVNGSKRLKLAAQRGYRHDGIYRDERMAEELPGFVADSDVKLRSGTW